MPYIKTAMSSFRDCYHFGRRIWTCSHLPPDLFVLVRNGNNSLNMVGASENEALRFYEVNFSQRPSSKGCSPLEIFFILSKKEFKTFLSTFDFIDHYVGEKKILIGLGQKYFLWIVSVMFSHQRAVIKILTFLLSKLLILILGTLKKTSLSTK